MMKKLKLFFACLLMAVLSIGQVWGDVWVKVTAAPTDWSGEYLLVYEPTSSNSVYVYTGIDGQNGVGSESATLSNGLLTKPADATAILISARTGTNAGKYSIKILSGTNKDKYIGRSSNSNGIELNASELNNEISYSTDQVTIKSAGGAYLRFNSASNEMRFRYYKSSSYTGQQKIQLYKKCYTVTYNKNGGTGTMTDSNSPYAPNATVTVLTNTFTAPEGKTFDSWNNKADGSGDDFGASFTITKDTTLYAQWASASCTDKVNITKGTPESGASFNLSKTGEQNCCEALTVNVTGITAPTGKIFKEITQTGIAAGNVTIDNNAKTVTYAAGTSGNSTINVVFDDIPSHSVTWSANGTTNIVSYQEGASITFPATATGCIGGTFMGWAAAEISGTRATAPTYVKSATMGTSDLTYYAVFATASGSGAATYTLVSSADDFEDGTYVVAGLSSDTYYFMNGTAVAKGLGVEETGLATSALTSNSFTAELLPENAIEVEVEDDGDPDGDNHYYFISYTSGENTYFMDDGGSGSDLTWTTNAQVYTYHPNFDAKATAGCCLLSSSGTKVSQNSNTMASWIRNYASSGNYYNDLYFFKKSGGYTYSDYRTSCCTPHAITANGIGGGLVLDPNVTEACAGTEITLTASTPDGSHQGIGVIKVVETADPENDVTSTVYNAGTLTMPDYAITITATYAEKSTPSAAADPAALDFGSPLQGAPVAAQTFSLTGSALEEGTLTLVAPAGFTVEPSSIEVSAGALSAQTITVTPSTSAAGNKSGNITISGAGISPAIDLVALTMDVQATYSVNWYVNGTKIDANSVKDVEGTVVTAPTNFSAFTDCSDLHFVGWAESAIEGGSSTEAPTTVTPITAIGTTDKNYYAVFAAGTPGGTALVTSTTELTNGTKVYLYSEKDAFTGVAKAYVSGNNVRATTGTVTGNALTPGEGACAYTIGVTSNGYTFNDGANYLYAASTSQNHLKGRDNIGDDQSAEFSISISNGEASIVSVGNTDRGVMQFNKNADTGDYTKAIFSCYAAADNTKYGAIKLFKQTAPNFSMYYTTCPSCNSVSFTKAGQENSCTFALQRNSADVTSVNTCEDVTVDVVASPATGYELTNIEVNGVTGASVNVEFTQISIPQDADGTLTVTATFSQKNYSIAVQTYPASIGATLTGATSTAKYGVPQTISTDEPTGYLFGGWYMFDASTFDAENINWNADLSSEIFTGTYVGEDLELEASFPMPDKNLVAVAYFDKLYTVSEFLALGEKSTTETYYIQGLVSNVQGYYSSKYITYYISDNGEGGSGATTLKIYNGLNENGASFTNINNLTVGDKVIVEGKWDSEHSNIGANNKLCYHQTLSLSSVVVSAPDASLVKSEYFTGETFSYAGLKATAVYNTGYQKDVTSEATFKANGSATLTVSGNTTVNVTAAWNETTSADYPVTITVTTKVLQPELTLSETALTGYLGQALPKPATITAHFVDNTVPSTENVTLQAVIDENDVYDASSTAEQTIPVKYTFGPNDATANYTVTLSSIHNSLATAYSVEEARAIINLDQEVGNDLDLANTDNTVWVLGRVTSVETNQIIIKDDADETKVLYLWKYEIDTEISSVEVGDLIKAYGNLYYHAQSGKYELNEGCEIVWKQPKVSIEISNQTMEIGENWTISATIVPAAAPVTYSIKNDGSDAYVSLNTLTNVITANAAGTAKIIAHADDFEEYLGNEKEFTVTVKPAAVHTNVVLYVEFGGNYYAVNNEGEATQIDVLGGKVVVANEATKNKIVWDCAEREGAATFYNTTAAKYLNGSNSTTLGVAASEGTYTNWTWTEDKYYTSNPSASTVRTFLYQGNATNFGNYAKSNAGKSTDGGYSNYATIYTGEVVVGTIETLRESATWTGEKWGTYCPRYNVTAMQGASFFKLNYMELNTDGSPYKFFFDEIGEGANLEAGKPYLFITEENVTAIKGVKYGSAAADGLHVHNGFVGYLGSGNYDLSSDNDVYTEGANNYYGLQNNIFKLIYGTSSYMINERAFIQITPTSKPATTEQPAPKYSRRRLVVGAGAPQVTTGTENIEASETPVKVMIDGQLFIIRGEKMYDATGRLVK